MHDPIYLVYNWPVSNDRSCLIGVCTDETRAVQLIKKAAPNSSLKEVPPGPGEVKRFEYGKEGMGEFDRFYVEKTSVNTLLW